MMYPPKSPLPSSSWRVAVCSSTLHSLPVYRLQRVISGVLCLLLVLLLSVLTSLLLRGGARQDKEEENYSLDEYDEEDSEELVMSEDYEERHVSGGNDDEEEYYENNPVFDMSYFDFSIKNGDAEAKGNQQQQQQYHQKQKNQQEEEEDEEKSIIAFKTPSLLPYYPAIALPHRRLVGRDGKEVVWEGIFFSPMVEELLGDRGMSDRDVGRVLWRLRHRGVLEMRDPSWERCGRPKNQWVRMDGGLTACARYRHPDEHLLLGEVLSFYLSRMLRLSHVPPPATATLNHPRWAPAAPQMERAGWGDSPVVVLTPWLPDLQRDYMPPSLRLSLTTNTTVGLHTEEGEEVLVEGEQHKVMDRRRNRGDGQRRGRKEQKIMNRRIIGGRERKENNRKETAEARERGERRRGDEGKETNRRERGGEGSDVRESRRTPPLLFTPSLQEASEEELRRLLQWSDMILFDFLTANYDRVAYMMDAAKDEEEGGSKEKLDNILSRTIHNLVRNKNTGSLWFLDNESGLIDGYTILYNNTDTTQARRFMAFHLRLLRAMCVFRRATVISIMALNIHPKPHELLVAFARENEPFMSLLPNPLSERFLLGRLSERLKEVVEWVKECVRLVGLEEGLKR